MRTRFSLTACLMALVCCTACESPSPKKSDSSGDKKGANASNPSNAKSGSTSTGISTSGEKRVIFTKDNNPTTRAKRGEPSLTDQFRPAAWILIDGKEGQFTDPDGQQHLEWVIDQPVHDSPTFRVEILDSLLGNPDEFSCVIETMSSPDGTQVRYGLSAKGGTFQFGKDYNLLNPGPEFSIKNLSTYDRVGEIAPLPPGRYLIAAGIKNTKSDAKTAAVTYFTVKE